MYEKLLLIFCLLASTSCRHLVSVSKDLCRETEPCSTKDVSNTICCNVTSALELTNLNDTNIIIHDNQTLNKNFSFSYIYNLTISTPSSKKIMIECTGTMNGLVFQHVNNVAIENAIMLSCGKMNVFMSAYAYEVNSGIAFANSSDVSLINIEMTHSQGYGIFMSDVSGKVHVNDAVISKNIIVSRDLGYSSGGGMFIEYTKYAHAPKESNLLFDNCVFVSNKAEDVVINEFDDKHLPFGKGGGLVLHLLDIDENNTILFKNVAFLSNSASFGGGLYVLLSNQASKNTLQFQSLNFTRNNASYEGGGAFITHTNIGNVTSRNTIRFCDSHFLQNRARIGGALSHLQFSTTYKFQEEVKFEHCSIVQNTALLAAAIRFKHTKVSFHSVNITENRNHNTAESLGVVYMFESSVTLRGTNFIMFNEGSAFLLDCSNLLALGHVQFYKNIAGKGGAMTLYGSSRIVLNDNTNLVFRQNAAYQKGGGIYVTTPGPSKIPQTVSRLRLYSCFFQFLDSFGSASKRNNFKGNVSFEENSANLSGSSIFTTTLYNCFSPDQKSIANVLTTWKGFFISNQTIATHAVTIVSPLSDWNYTAWPGLLFKPKISLFDEMNSSVDEAVDLLIESQGNVYVEANYRFVLQNSSISLKLLSKKQIATFNLTISVVDYGSTRLTFHNIGLKPCYYGYSLINGRCRCNLQKNQAKGISVCSGGKIYLFKGRWADPTDSRIKYDNESTTVCPVNYCNTTVAIGKNSLTGYERLFDPDKPQQCVENRNESSKLCSECIAGYSVGIGGENCLDCSGRKRYFFIWITLCLAIIISLVVLFVLWLNIDIYSNYLNGFLYYYQIVTLLTTTNFDYPEPLKTTIGLINLNTPGYALGGSSFCFTDGFNDFQKNLFNYFFPSWMIFVLICTALYARRRKNSFITKKGCLGAFTIISVIAYSDFTRITFLLIDMVTIDGQKLVMIYAKLPYNTGKHVGYMVFGIFAILLIVIACPILLIISPWLTGLHCKHFVNPFARWQPIFNEFKHCFRRNCRWFASYYFLCRALLLGVGTFLQKDPLQNVILTGVCFLVCVIFVLLKPYKDTKMNLFDSMVLANLTAVGILSLGMRSAFDTSERNVFTGVISVLIHIPLLITFGRLCYNYGPIILNSLRQCYYKQKRDHKNASFPKRSLENVITGDK